MCLCSKPVTFERCWQFITGNLTQTKLKFFLYCCFSEMFRKLFHPFPQFVLIFYSCESLLLSHFALTILSINVTLKELSKFSRLCILTLFLLYFVTFPLLLHYIVKSCLKWVFCMKLGRCLCLRDGKYVGLIYTRVYGHTNTGGAQCTVVL